MRAFYVKKMRYLNYKISGKPTLLTTFYQDTVYCVKPQSDIKRIREFLCSSCMIELIFHNIPLDLACYSMLNKLKHFSQNLI